MSELSSDFDQEPNAGDHVMWLIFDTAGGALDARERMLLPELQSAPAEPRISSQPHPPSDCPAKCARGIRRLHQD